MSAENVNSLLPPGLLICLSQDLDFLVYFLKASCLLLCNAESSLLEAWLMDVWLQDEGGPCSSWMHGADQ